MSARQAEIADLVVSGKSNREIADVLCLSPRTVESHVAALFSKLGVRSRTELVSAVLRPAGGESADQRTSSSTNLPLQLKRLVDRETELSDIARALESARLVTLTGAGGVGKTRTAFEVGLQLAQRWPDGVCLVELASVRDPGLIAAAVALALGIPDSPQGLPLAMLIGYLKKKSLLLIIDNCEHLIGGAAALADELLKSCARLHILATSREALKIAGERAYRLPSLRVPAPAALASLRASVAASYGAIALFTERAHAVNQHFALTDENASTVAEICRRLDGIALAIELAAARVNVLSVRELSRKLDDRFDLLTKGDRTALARHQTMRALIDWSYDALSPDEQRLFEGLSIFAGGCTREAAGAVLGVNGADVFDTLSSLVEKSLAAADLEGSEPRYRLLESARLYAREKLCARGDERRVAENHAIAFVRLAEQLERTWDSASDRVWLSQAEAELENWRAALDWSLVQRRDVVLGQRLAGVLQPVWTHFACTEGRQWVALARACIDATTPAGMVAQLDYAEALIALTSSELAAALAGGERALAGFEALGDSLGAARARHVIGLSLLYHGRADEGEPLLREALTTLRGLGRGRYVGFSLARIAYARTRVGDIVAARAYYAEALEIFATLGAERGAAIVTSNLAEAEFCAGDSHAALRLATRALASYRAQRYTNVVTHALINVAAYEIALGHYSAARSHAHEALELALEQRLDVIVAWAVQHLAAVASLRPEPDQQRRRFDWERAALLIGFADARLNGLGVLTEYDFTEKQEFDRVCAALTEALGRDEFDRCVTKGASMSPERAVADALLV